MITYIIAVILAVLIVITILHDISIFRLERKVDMLQTFIDVALRRLEDYALRQKSNADQRIQDVESVEPTWTKEEHEAFYTFLWNVINPNEMQDYIEMFETKDEPQTDCPWR